MTVLFLLLTLAGVICFAVGAFSNRIFKVDFVSLGLLLVFLVPLLQLMKQL